MAKTNTPAFAQSPKTGTAVVTVALANLGADAPTGMILLATAGAEGALVSKLLAIPRATVTASSLVLFLVKASAPSAYRIIDSELMAAYTLSATSAIPETLFANITEAAPMRLEAGDKLYVGSQVALASGIVFKCEWTDF